MSDLDALIRAKLSWGYGPNDKAANALRAVLDLAEGHEGDGYAVPPHALRREIARVLGVKDVV